MVDVTWKTRKTRDRKGALLQSSRWTLALWQATPNRAFLQSKTGGSEIANRGAEKRRTGGQRNREPGCREIANRVREPGSRFRAPLRILAVCDAYC